MAYSKYRRLKMMQEAQVAARLFRQPGAFNFRPSWPRRSAGLPSTMYRRHAVIGREVRMAKKLFAKKSAFRFRPTWRGAKRKSSKGLLAARRKKRGKFITKLSDGRKLYQFGAFR